MSLKIYKITRKIHKWTSIGFGVFLLIWIITGIFYVLPVSVLAGIDRLIIDKKHVKAGQTEQSPANNEYVQTQASFRDVKVSIPKAISILEAEIGHTVQVADCSIYRHSDTLVYEITLKDSGKYLIDAIEGKPTKITEAEIKKNAIKAAPSGSNIVYMNFLAKRPYAYWGPVPVYRFIFGDVSRTHVYISPNTGQVELMSKRWNRLRGWMLSLHKFEFLMLILEREAFRKGMLLIFSLIGLAVVITGFYIALPVKWLRRLPGNQAQVTTKPKKTR